MWDFTTPGPTWNDARFTVIWNQAETGVYYARFASIVYPIIRTSSPAPSIIRVSSSIINIIVTTSSIVPNIIRTSSIAQPF